MREKKKSIERERGEERVGGKTLNNRKEEKIRENRRKDQLIERKKNRWKDQLIERKTGGGSRRKNRWKDQLM